MLPLLRRATASSVPEISILMVCLGNICRSPMAEAVLRAKLQRSGLDRRIVVASAGTHGERGGAPDARAVAAAAKRGYDLSRIRSRRIASEDFERHDVLLAMDRENLEFLSALCPPPQRERLGLLLDHAPPSLGLREVPDPYYGAPAGFERVLDLIEPACDGLLVALRRRLGTS